MFKVEKVEINGFWYRFDLNCQFNEDVNIIIGRNGTGKTTFMNIFHSILRVDLTELSKNDFEKAKVTLIKDGRRKTIKVVKIESDDYPYPLIEYYISGKKKTLRVVGSDERRLPPSMRRRSYEESLELRHELYSLTAVSSLSVYRLRNDDEREVRDRHGSRIVAPVDYRLSQVLAGLTEFQLELAEQAQVVSKSLQKDVLASILYGEDDTSEQGWGLDFDKDGEKKQLISAYKQLNSFDSSIKKKINFHVSSIDDSIQNINVVDKGNAGAKIVTSIKPLEALRKTRRIIALSLDAKNQTQNIYSQIDLFLLIVKEFIFDKVFSFSSGRLVIENDYGEIDLIKLSSGEKQLIILLVEALLQKNKKHIFLADEPELSLHIAWQRKIIPAIKKINPNAQIIVATHSPEVASKYKGSIFDMEELISE